MQTQQIVLNIRNSTICTGTIGWGRAVQEADVVGRPQSASEGIRELQRILCTSTAAAASQADSGEWAFDHTLLEAAVTVLLPLLLTCLHRNTAIHCSTLMSVTGPRHPTPKN